MFTFLIQSLITTFTAIGGYTTFVVIVMAITKWTVDIQPKQYARLVTWIFFVVLAIKGLILAHHQHN